MGKNKFKQGKSTSKNRKSSNFRMTGVNMVTFREANHARIALKIPLSYYSWFKSLTVECENGQYFVAVMTTHIDNSVKDAVPPFVKGIEVRVEPDSV